jgi:WD40 repeat protein/class 3 adenylate cyclase
MVAPGGTVTLLFTDIEGSTALLERLRERYAEVLEAHRTLLRDAFGRWDGHEVDTQGDSFFVAFSTATDAISCAVDAQRAVLRHEWPAGGTVRVRMGMHTGEPVESGAGYVGIDVHRAARIGAAGHGGQILVSDRTRGAADERPEGVAFRSLGMQRFKGLSEPIELFQVVVDGLPETFGPLRTSLPDDEPPAAGSAPYKGLVHFDERDRRLFHGREELTADVVRLLQAERLLAVVGASGSGKSSLVRAGVVPALKSQKPPWRTVVMTPTAEPQAALARAVGGASATDAAAESNVAELQRRARGAPTLLVVDQLEELFTLCRTEEDRVRFVDSLIMLATAGEGSPIHVVLTLRADFYARLSPYADLRDAVAQHQVFVGPMSITELRAAIEEPARQDGWEIAPGLVDLLLRDIGREPGSLPLLSHALLETWRRRRGKIMTLKGYFESGEIRGAIARTADRVYDRLDDHEKRLARLVMLRLTEPGEESPTRRRAELSELVPAGADGAESESVLRRLVEARLVTIDEGSAEVAHEALLREWPQLRQWLDEDRAGLRLQRQVTDAAREWVAMARDEDALLRGARLVAATEWAAANGEAMSALEREFVDASAEAARREEAQRAEQLERELATARRATEAERLRAEEQTAATKRLRRRAVIAGVTGVVAVAAAVAAAYLGWQAQVAATRAQARELASAAESNLAVDPERSILLAQRAVRLGSGDGAAPLPEAIEALHRAVQASRIVAVYNGHEGQVVGAAVNADGSRVATLGVDGTLRLWDGDGAEIGSQAVTAPVTDQTTTISFSPDGLVYAPDGADVVEVGPDGTRLRTFAGPASGPDTAVQVTSTEVSADGDLLVRGATDGTVALYDIASGALLRAITITAGMDGCPPPEGQGPTPCAVIALALSADKSRLAVGNFGMPTAHVIDLATDEVIASVAHGDIVGAIELSADGRTVVLGGWDTITTVWNVDENREMYSLYDHRSLINGLDIDLNGRLATSSADGSVRLVELETGRRLAVIPAHASAAFAGRFSADGRRLVTSSGDESARLWDVSPTTGREVALMRLADRGWSIEYSPDGAEVITATVSGGQLAFWNALDGTLRAATDGPPSSATEPLPAMLDMFLSGDRVYTVQNDSIVAYDREAREVERWTAPLRITSAAASPDGRLLAIGRSDGVDVVQLASHEPVFSIEGFGEEVGSVAFSPDGSILGVAGRTRGALVNVADGSIRASLEDHSGPLQVITFAPDGDLAVTGSNDATAKVWRTSDGSVVATLTGHVSPVYGVDFSADGTMLATGSIDSTIKLWDTRNFGERPLTLTAHSAAVYDVAFRPDGLHIASSSRDGTARVFSLQPDELLRLGDDHRTRSLTPAECLHYLHTPDCR